MPKAIRQCGRAASDIVEFHSTLNQQVRIYGHSPRECSANFELLVRLTLNYPRFGSHNSELSRGSGAPWFIGHPGCPLWPAIHQRTGMVSARGVSSSPSRPACPGLPPTAENA